MLPSNDNFKTNAKNEIHQRLKSEEKAIKKIEDKIVEFNNNHDDYEQFYKQICSYIQSSMIEFTQNEEDLPKYFKSNLSEIYQNYSQIRKDANEEIKKINSFISKCDIGIGKTKNSLKFFKSQFDDSDFYDDCQPLVETYEKKIDLIPELEKSAGSVVEVLEKIAKKLEKWE